MTTVSTRRITVEQFVTEATDPSKDTDWLLITQFCDLLNSKASKEGVSEALKPLRKRMKSKDSAVLLHCLEILDSTMKNCVCVRPVFNEKEWMNILRDLATSKTTPTVRDRALAIIHLWGVTFSGSHEYPNYHSTFKKLQASGVEFPPSDPAPIFSPPRAIVTAPPSRGYPAPVPVTKLPPFIHAESSRTTTTTPSKLLTKEELQKEIDAVKESNALLLEMMRSADAARDDVKSNDTIAQLIENIKQSQPKILQVIQNENDETVTSELLSANDGIVRVLEQYDLLCKGGHIVTPPQPVSPTPRPPSPRRLSPRLNATAPSVLPPPIYPEIEPRLMRRDLDFAHMLFETPTVPIPAVSTPVSAPPMVTSPTSTVPPILPPVFPLPTPNNNTFPTATIPPMNTLVTPLPPQINPTLTPTASIDPTPNLVPTPSWLGSTSFNVTPPYTSYPVTSAFNTTPPTAFAMTPSPTPQAPVLTTPPMVVYSGPWSGNTTPTSAFETSPPPTFILPPGTGYTSVTPITPVTATAPPTAYMTDFAALAAERHNSRVLSSNPFNEPQPYGKRT
ncbi:target of Myb protein 1 [Pelomyxa schiedti]|nr:target of Myb protein 1 [Pelomyxa schiedti]